MRWRFAAAALIGAALSVPATAQRFPEPHLYQLLPPDYPYPLIRVCSTPEGICLIPFTVFPGAPCQCQRADGVWVPGVCTR